MSTLCRHLDAYLKLRRQLGFKLDLAGQMLRHFVRYADQEKAAFVTVKLALRWATQPAGRTLTRNATRLGYVRGFARYLSAYDPRTEIPPVGLVPGQFCRRTPHLYQDGDIVRLLEATRHIDGRNEFKGMAYATCLASRYSTPSRLIGTPRALGNRAAMGCAFCSRNHTRKSATTSFRSGTQRVFRPLPVQRT